MSAGKELVSLGNLVTIVMGQAPSSKDCNSDGRGTPFVKAGEFGASRPVVREWTTNPLKLARRSDVLMCVVGATCGKLNLGEDCAIGRSVAAIRPELAKLDQFYLHYFLMTLVDRLRASSVGAAQTVISKEMIQSVLFPWRELREQRRIVAILDEAFESIATAKANAEKNLQHARDFAGIGYRAITESYDRFRWPVVQVAALAADHKGSMRTGPFGSQLLHSEFVDEGVAVLGIDNAVANEFRWDRRRYITEEKYRQLARYRVQPGDVLITIMGTCGRCAVVPDDIPLAINTKHLCCITLDRGKCLPEFLHSYFLHDPKARDYLDAQAKGSIMAGLNMGIISELPVLLPPHQQQAEITDRFDSLRAECLRLEVIQLRKLAALDELKKSLLHQAFTGQLTSSKPVRVAKQVALPTTTPQFSANVIAIAHARHERRKRDKTFGHIKEQKLLHLVEAIGKVDLGRWPIKDAAGPNDFGHMLKAEQWARDSKFFEMVERGGRYDFKKLEDFELHLAKAAEALGPHLGKIEDIIDLLIPMDSEGAEVFATVHAAWNNLLIDGAEITDGSILLEARDRWHSDKLEIPEHKFTDALRLIRAKGLIPDGTGKYVGGQQQLV